MPAWRNPVLKWLGSLIDVRPGEGRKTALLFVYYLLVLFAYYILKPVSRALFLDNFDADRLPWLYILMALFGGAGASWISKAAVHARLTDVIGWAQLFLISNILVIWWLLQYPSAALLYVFSVWVGTFSIITASQFWMLASHLFDPRSARRIFPLIGLAAVVGAASGGVFTSVMVHVIGARHLMLASGGLMAITWFVIRALRRYDEVRKGLEAETEYRLRDTIGLVVGSPHLRAVSALVCLMFIVDTLVDYQFSVMAKETYQKEQLIGFLAQFQGVYLNVISFILQIFVTGVVLRHLGVGGALAFAPLAVASGSAAFLTFPSMVTAGITRAAEAATRYTFTRTGMELLYLPIPPDIKNRTKIFLDVFVDRVSRGAAGGLLLLLTSVFAFNLRGITMVIVVFVVLWLGAISFVLRTYVGTLKKSIEKREVHFEELAVDPSDAATVGVLLRSLDSSNPREVVYALSLLEQVPRVSLGRRARAGRLADSPSPEVQAATLRFLALRRDRTLVPQARALLLHQDQALQSAAVHYVCQADSNPAARLQEFLTQPDLSLRLAAVIAAEEYSYPRPLPVNNAWFQELMDWTTGDAEKARLLAARALPLADSQGGQPLSHLRRLLADGRPSVVNAALVAARAMELPNEWIPSLIQCLAAPATRSEARAVLNFQSGIIDYLRRYLDDPEAHESIRRSIPRLLGDIGTSPAAELLTHYLPKSTIGMRFDILKALNRIRRDHPEVPIPGNVVDAAILDEARRYYELLLSMSEQAAGDSDGGKLLARSLESRLDQTLERIFRLLGLRYPPEEIYDAYRAVRSSLSQRRAAALEFLDNTLGEPYKQMILPALEETSWERLEPLGVKLFGLEPISVEQSLKQLINGDDKWLKMMALYRAAELRIPGLEQEIRMAESDPDPHVAETARHAGRFYPALSAGKVPLEMDRS